MRKALYLIFTLLLTASLIVGIAGCAPAEPSEEETSTEETIDISKPLPATKRLRVATTTSLYDTGLWAFIEPMFEKKYSVEVDVMYAGTGKAIEYGTRGDVDVIAVHAKASEEKFIADGYSTERVPFAYNYFLIVGPESDPAGIRGMKPEEAFNKLMTDGSGTFVSRGDSSGTHTKEKEIWKLAGYEYAEVQNAGAWYVEAGTGMGPTLTMASEKTAYTLTDIGTFLAYKGKIELVPIVDKGSVLLNVYSALAVSPEKTGVKNADLAQKMVEFLTSAEVQKAIGDYGVGEYGQQLFTPCAGNEPTE